MRLTLWFGGVPPVPLKVMELGELDALLIRAADPLAAPVACGVKVTDKDADLPAATVSGNGPPPMENSLLFKFADESVTLAPEAFNTRFCVDVLPTATVPKFKLPGATLNCPRALPSPDSITFSIPLGASEDAVSVPEAAPLALGLKVTVKV